MGEGCERGGGCRTASGPPRVRSPHAPARLGPAPLAWVRPGPRPRDGTVYGRYPPPATRAHARTCAHARVAVGASGGCVGDAPLPVFVCPFFCVPASFFTTCVRILCARGALPVAAWQLPPRGRHCYPGQRDSPAERGRLRPLPTAAPGRPPPLAIPVTPPQPEAHRHLPPRRPRVGARRPRRVRVLLCPPEEVRQALPRRPVR